MKKWILALALLLMLPSLAAAQGNALVIPFNGAPTGTCAFIMFARDTTTDALYSCSAAGTWVAVAVSSSIGGNLLPSTDNTYTLGNASFRWSNVVGVLGTFGSVNLGSGTLGDTSGALIKVANNTTWLSAKKNGSGSCDIGINTSNQFTFSCPGVFSGDMLVVPSVAGDAASPSNGAFWNNTTTNKLRVQENGAILNVIGATSYALGSSDTVTCSVVSTTETAFATTLTIPANLLAANRGFQVTWLLSSTSSGTASTFVFRQRLTNVSGTVLYNNVAGPPAGNNASGLVYAFHTVTMGTAAPGASVNTYTGTILFTVGNGGTSTNNTAQPVAFATNAAQTLVLTAQCNNSTAGNSVTLIGATLRPL